MALFGKDRERDERPRGIGPEPILPPAIGRVSREVEMFERERDGAQSGEASGTSAFLGKGSRVTGKLVFEGTVRIEGQVEGEITAREADQSDDQRSAALRHTAILSW